MRALKQAAGGEKYRLSEMAVAVRQDASGPEIVASGRGAVAEQILALAFANGVKVRQDADLVEILACLDVGSEVPLEALAAVAEILSYVYRANAAAAPRGGEAVAGHDAASGG